MLGPITLTEKLWARTLNAKLLSHGCAPVYLKSEGRIKFLGNRDVPQHLWDQLQSPERRNIFATFLWNEILKGIGP